MNVLALESKLYYDNLFDFKSHDVNVEFDGLKKYNVSDSELLKYDFIINFTFNSRLVDFMIYRACNLNITTILFSDGIYEWTNAFYNPIFLKNNITLFKPVLNNYLFCVGDLELKYFKFKGINTIQYLPTRMKPKIAYKSKNNNNNKFLITTSNSPYFNSQEKKSLIKLLKDIVQQLDKLKISYIFRIYDREIIDALDIKKKNNFLKISIDECLKKVDNVFSTPSSINLIAMSFDIPVATLIYRDSPITFSSGWNLSSYTDISKCIESMTNRDKDRMDFQYFQVNNYYSTKKIDFKKLKSKNDNLETKHSKESTIYYNLLMSKFNFNLEFASRKLYLMIKKLFKRN